MTLEVKEVDSICDNLTGRKYRINGFTEWLASIVLVFIEFEAENLVQVYALRTLYIANADKIDALILLG